MKYYRDIDDIKTEIKTNGFSNYWTKHALRSHFGEDDGKDMDYYNSIYAESELMFFNKSFGRQIELIVGGLIFGWILAFIYLFIAQFVIADITINYLTISWIISSIVLYLLLNLWETSQLNYNIKSNTKHFNDSEITENKEWLAKNSNGKYDLIWEPDGDESDHKHLEIDEEEYEYIRKYWYEIENFEGFPNSSYIYETLYDKADWILFRDIPENATIIR